MADTSENVVSNGTSLKDITPDIKLIGKGGFGNVYGPCVWEGRTCAIKKRFYANDQTTMEKDRKACEKWMSLDHKNLIAVYDVSVESSALYVVMEFASGGSLKEFLEGCKSDLLPEIQKNWVKQIAEGMKYLHEKKVVHRDLKSPNIVLMVSDPVSNPYEKTLKITDFDQIRELTHTAKVTGVGTYAWKAPEYIKEGTFSKASDVWSFGVVLWEILTRKIPHQGLEDCNIIGKMLTDQLKLEIQYSSADIMKKILIRCMCYNHKSRTSFNDIYQVLKDPPDEILNQWTEKEDKRLLKISALLIRDKSTVFQSDGGSSRDNQQKNQQPKEHETLIKRHYNKLIERLNVPDAEALMFKLEKLTLKEHEHLRQFHATPTKASEELLSIVMKGPSDTYKCFLQSLQDTKQHHLYQLLTSDGSLGELCVSEHGRIIQQNFVWLLETLIPGPDLLARLYSSGVLSRREYSELSDKNEEFKKNDLLLGFISRKSPDDFQKFIIALNATQQQHIAARLTSKSHGFENPGDVDQPLIVFDDIEAASPSL